MRKDSPLAEQEAVSAEDLWNKPLIVSHQASNNTEMFHWLKADTSAVLNVRPEAFPGRRCFQIYSFTTSGSCVKDENVAVASLK